MQDHRAGRVADAQRGYVEVLRLSPDQPEGLNRDSVLTVHLVRGFCAQLGIVEKPVLTALRRCREAAYALWPAMIEAATLTDRMKAGLLRQLTAPFDNIPG